MIANTLMYRKGRQPRQLGVPGTRGPSCREPELLAHGCISYVGHIKIKHNNVTHLCTKQKPDCCGPQVRGHDTKVARQSCK